MEQIILDWQVILNWLQIFILPALIGLIVRTAFLKVKKGFFVSICFAGIMVIAMLIAVLIPNYGSELYAIIAIQGICLMVGSLISGGIILLVKKIKSKKALAE